MNAVDTDNTRCRVAILDDWQDAARSCADWTRLEARASLAFFGEPFASEDEAADRLAPFDVILAMRERTAFPASLIERLPKLRMFNLSGMRAALVDMAFMQSRAITVCLTEGGPGVESTADLTLALMLSAVRDLQAASGAVREGRFQRGTRPGVALAGKTLGLVGLGKIGARVAGYGRALGMRVIAWSPNLTAARAADAGVEYAAKETLFSTADVVSVHLVLSARTAGVVGRNDIARMKDGATLVNTSRARLVDEAALIDAVREGHIVAALDVFDQEPLPRTHPLVAARHTVLTPHLGYSTRDVYEVFYRQQVENTLAFLDGKPIRTLA
jgi:D-3-phosphoglycerate dehydrogenase